MWPAAAMAAGAAGFLSWAVRGRSSRIFGPSVWRGPAGCRRIALTFDDGPSESTPALLDLLRRYDAKATFFVCGHNAQRLPGMLRDVARAGHEIGNHTWSHSRLDFAAPSKMRDEIGRTQEIVRAITGATPRLFRAPYGVRWFGLGSVQKEFQLMGVMWTAIGLDWKLPAEGVAGRLLKSAHDGAILCLHDGRVLKERPDITPTLDAVREILPRLRERNLAITSVSAMLER
ncbi:MAG: polysaccharide deacetylase family protein [Bryobacteraceae bacterium]